MGFQELWATYGSMYLMAWTVTMKMALISYVSATLLGCIVSIMRISPIYPLRLTGDAYIHIFRNIPAISLLVIVVYALPNLKIILPYDACVMVTAALIGAAFASENIMTGINTIALGQIEAARSLGFTFMQSLRAVILPQALRSCVLPMTNLLIALILTTAIASQVPLVPQELTGLVSYINTRAVGGVTAFAISAFGYVSASIVVAYAGNKLDRMVRIKR